MPNPDDPFAAPYERLRRGFSSWINLLQALSPASPDYRARLEAEWVKQGLSESFWRLEELVVPNQAPPPCA